MDIYWKPEIFRYFFLRCLGCLYLRISNAPLLEEGWKVIAFTLWAAVALNHEVASAEGVALPTSGSSCEFPVRLRGPLTKQSVESAILKMEVCGASELTIDSSGGDEVAAIRLARFLKHNNSNLVIDGWCLSACSQIVMLSMDKVEIKSWSSIGMHHSSLAIYEWSSKFVGKDVAYNLLSRDSEAIAKETIKILDNPAKLEILRAAFSNVRPTCLLVPRARGVGKVMVRMETGFWMPKREEIERSGIKITGAWENISLNPAASSNRARPTGHISSIIRTNDKAVPRCK